MTTPTNDDGTSLRLNCHESRQDDGFPPEKPPGLLTMRAAIILLGSGVIGGAVGALTYLSTSDTAKALLAGLAAAGASTVALHGLIGH